MRDKEINLPINCKRLLSIEEFCVYTGLKKTNAWSFARRIHVLVRTSARVVRIDRVKFDAWCDSQNGYEWIDGMGSSNGYRGARGSRKRGI